METSQAIKEEINQKSEHIRESPPHGGLIFLAEPRNITVFSVVVVIFVSGLVRDGDGEWGGKVDREW